ncbi:hypothetical protein FA15DRAFT_694849 [Coprinopsis marcescibilis]|uniref:DUF6699 domain-containing protein n=1 Tax=Coprinopsis marcescibilis TaxID=230819 RepID=A0A5C3KU97_COPMA|nr:hypothetical protein FA15DRAFT_694849 [Coprinopsis marcescibilis]
MPSFKKVRFSKTSTVVAPATPALSIGSLSGSSNGPITPPNYTTTLPLPGPTPYGYTYQGKSRSDPRSQYGYSKSSSSYGYSAPSIQAHPYLEGSSRPAISYNLLDAPSTATAHMEPATNPPLPSIILQAHHLPWHIRIIATRRTYVTVWDVLEQLYSTLRSYLTQPEYEAMRHSERERATSAYEQRYRRFRSRTEYNTEKAGGMRRVDLLFGRTTFYGLSKPQQGYDVWVLNTG